MTGRKIKRKVKRMDMPGGMAWYISDDDEDQSISFSTPIPPIPPMPPNPPNPPFSPKMFSFSTGKGHTQRVHQSIDDDTVTVLIVIPGIEKSSLKIRSKVDKVSISVELQEKYVDKLGSKENSFTIDLIDDVIPEGAKASYADGIVTIKFPVAHPGHEVGIEEEE